MADERIWILIVEDDTTSRKILANQLHKKGFEVVCAEDGEQAVEIIKYCTPDCIVLDLVMPKMHGQAFLSLLREKNQTLPVIVMSALENKPDIVATMGKIGIQGWMSKPVDPREVAVKIKGIVESHQKTMGTTKPTDDSKGAPG